MARWAIIGSGLAGVTLASHLSPRHEVVMFEKSHGSAGRMSTRRRSVDGKDFAFDHGAQYFTIKGSAFQEAMQPYRDQGVVQPWAARMITIDGADIENDASAAHPGQDHQPPSDLFVACPSMTGLAKAMAEGLDVHHQIEIKQLDRGDNGWQLTDQQGQVYGGFDGVVTAIPAPQAMALLPMAAADLAPVKMLGCFTLMLGFEHDQALPSAWQAARVENSPIGFIAVNSSKPDRNSGASLVVQANNDWADPRVDDDPQAIDVIMRDELRRLTGIDADKACLSSFHRWRYGATRTPLGQAFWQSPSGDLAAIGDWCIKGRVEAAFESGRALAEAILND